MVGDKESAKSAIRLYAGFFGGTYEARPIAFNGRTNDQFIVVIDTCRSFFLVDSANIPDGCLRPQPFDEWLRVWSDRSPDRIVMQAIYTLLVNSDWKAHTVWLGDDEFETITAGKLHTEFRVERCP